MARGAHSHKDYYRMMTPGAIVKLGDVAVVDQYLEDNIHYWSANAVGVDSDDSEAEGVRSGQDRLAVP